MPDRPLSFLVAFAWTFGVTAVLVIGIQTTEALRPGSATDIVNLGTWETLVYGLGAFGVLRLHAPDRHGLPAVGIRPTSWGLVVLGLALGLALQVPAESLRQAVEHFFPPTAEELAARAALLSAESPTRVVVILLVSACLVPVLEEVFFRGALFSTLLRHHGGGAVAVMVAVFFVIGHPQATSWLPLAVVAAVLSHIRLQSGSLLPCLALHVAFNSVTVASVLLGVSTVTSPLRLAWWVIAIGWVVTLGLVYAVQSMGAASPDARLARVEDRQ